MCTSALFASDCCSTAFVTAVPPSFLQGWPDLLRAYSQHVHPCPQLIALLAESAHYHLPRLPLVKLANMAGSISILEPRVSGRACRDGGGVSGRACRDGGGVGA